MLNRIVWTVFNVSVNCVWDEWELGECSMPCGGGVRNGTRIKLVDEEYGGTCEGVAYKEEDCNMDPCPSTYYVLMYL